MCFWRLHSRIHLLPYFTKSVRGMLVFQNAPQNLPIDLESFACCVFLLEIHKSQQHVRAPSKYYSKVYPLSLFNPEFPNFWCYWVKPKQFFSTFSLFSFAKYYECIILWNNHWESLLKAWRPGEPLYHWLGTVISWKPEWSPGNRYLGKVYKIWEIHEGCSK